MAAALLVSVWYFFVPVKVELSPDFTIDTVERNGEDITSQLSESDLSEIRQILLTTSYSRWKYAIAPYPVKENTIEIAVWDDSYSPGRFRFCLLGGVERYGFQTIEHVYRIQNGEEMLRSILDIISG